MQIGDISALLDDPNTTIPQLLYAFGVTGQSLLSSLAYASVLFFV
jgi:hypothetical protein